MTRGDRLASVAVSHSMFRPPAPASLSKWVGESEKIMALLFDVAIHCARASRRLCIIFIDEIDALLASNDGDDKDVMRGVRVAFLQEMSRLRTIAELNKDVNVVVVAATNKPKVCNVRRGLAVADTAPTHAQWYVRCITAGP